MNNNELFPDLLAHAKREIEYAKPKLHQAGIVSNRTLFAELLGHFEDAARDMRRIITDCIDTEGIYHAGD